MKRAPVFLIAIILFFSCKKNDEVDNSTFGNAMGQCGLTTGTTYTYNMYSGNNVMDTGTITLLADTTVEDHIYGLNNSSKCMYEYCGDQNLTFRGNKLWFSLKINYQPHGWHGFLAQIKPAYFYNSGAVDITDTIYHFQFSK